MEPFWLFEQKPMGLAIFAVGIIFFALGRGFHHLIVWFMTIYSQN